MTLKSYRKESDLVKDIVASILKTYGGFALKVHGGRYQRTGIPDILYWFNGHSFAFEVKLDEAKYDVTALQKVKLSKLSGVGVHVAVVTSVQEALEFIDISMRRGKT